MSNSHIAIIDKQIAAVNKALKALQTIREELENEKPVRVRRTKDEVTATVAPKAEASKNDLVAALESYGFDPLWIKREHRKDKDNGLSSHIKRFNRLMEMNIPALEKRCDKYGADISMGQGRKSENTKKRILAVRIILAGK